MKSNIKDIIEESRDIASLLKEEAEKTILNKGHRSDEFKPPKEDNLRRSAIDVDCQINLIDELKEYKIDRETRRITYVIDRRNYDILQSLKSNNSISITDMINYFIEEGIKTHKKEINKIIGEQFKRIKL